MPEWFEEWFNDEYLALYPHRDEADAEQLVALLKSQIGWMPGWRVLDVACGPGRHARAIEAAGARCIGLDLSMTLLRRARAITAAPLIRADMRRLPVRPRSMDLTLNLFTSFGYFEDDAQHRSALAEMAGTVRAGGWFAMDFLNAARVQATLVPAETATLGGHEVRITRDLIGGERFVRKRMEIGDGRSWVERVRLFQPAELEQMLAETGISIVSRFGDYAGGPISPGSPRAILIGRAA
ncbi:MAG TPA: methyltransferase domain-containing protein [Gemmatimonadales bacterium]|nr:methyltransferase domain-containing protein [Gemmatimonadales bacterium]